MSNININECLKFEYKTVSINLFCNLV